MNQSLTSLVVLTGIILAVGLVTRLILASSTRSALKRLESSDTRPF